MIPLAGQAARDIRSARYLSQRGAVLAISPELNNNPVMVETDLNDRLLEKRPLLSQLAPRYVWWLTPAEALEYPQRVVAQVMNSGVFNDVAALSEALGESTLREVLQVAQAGQFDPPSWHYWHYRLGLAAPGAVPPVPQRKIPA